MLRIHQKLHYDKPVKKGNKGYEVAHIYPLNPSDTEVTLLSRLERLNSDCDHVDNLIPLCPTCHTKFDKPRTKEEYEILVIIKKSLIEQERINDVISKYELESNIQDVINQLYDFS